MTLNFYRLLMGALGLSALLLASVVHAEGHLRIARQFGIGYLLLDVVRDQQLIEKHGRARGLDITVEWHSISGATAMNEALLSGALDVVSAGAPPMLAIWDRTLGQQNVRALAALGSLPNYLLSNRPEVRTLRDFTAQDRIAVPAAGVGFQSRVLQIEAARLFGRQDFRHFDHISVSLPHPDATAELVSGATEVTAHFSSPPFQYQELGNAGVHKVISSYDIMGGPATFNLLYATQAFHDSNPQTCAALYEALAEAESWIRAHRPEAAETYLRVQHSRLPLGFVRRIVEDPEIDFTISPQRTQVYASQLYELGILKHRAASWKDYFFREAYARPGS